MLKRRSIVFALLFALGSIGGSADAADNIVVNGSFEDRISTNLNLVQLTNPFAHLFIAPWVIDGQIDWIGPLLWVASDGIRALDLNGVRTGGVRQTIPTVIGETYLLSFDLAANPNCGTPRDVTVSAAGESRDYHPDPVGHTTADLGWTNQEFTFEALNSDTEISFQSLVSGACGPALDNVRVELVEGTTNEQPDVSQAVPSTGTLWPPNKKMVDITIEGVTDPDGDAITITIDSIADDEGSDPDDASADGATASVRADRDGKGDGRDYTIHYTATDANGASVSSEVVVTVPHDQGKKGRAGKAAASASSWGEIKNQIK